MMFFIHKFFKLAEKKNDKVIILESFSNTKESVDEKGKKTIIKSCLSCGEPLNPKHWEYNYCPFCAQNWLDDMLENKHTAYKEIAKLQTSLNEQFKAVNERINLLKNENANLKMHVKDMLNFLTNFMIDIPAFEFYAGKIRENYNQINTDMQEVQRKVKLLTKHIPDDLTKLTYVQYDWVNYFERLMNEMNSQYHLWIFTKDNKYLYCKGVSSSLGRHLEHITSINDVGLEYQAQNAQGLLPFDNIKECFVIQNYDGYESIRYDATKITIDDAKLLRPFIECKGYSDANIHLTGLCTCVNEHVDSSSKLYHIYELNPRYNY